MLIKMGCGGVDMSSIHPKMWKVPRVVQKAYGDIEVVITSTWEGAHGESSLHYLHRALDFRNAPNDMQEKTIEIRQALDADYDVVWERDHLHIEYDPKGE